MSAFLNEYEAALLNAARLEAELAKQEAFLKVVFSHLVTELGGTIAKAEHEARSSKRYVDQLHEVDTVRQAAAEARAKATAMATRWETWRSQNASRRGKPQSGA